MKRVELHLGLSLCGDHVTIVGVECLDGVPVGLGRGGDVLGYVRSVFTAELQRVSRGEENLRNLLEFIAGSVVSPVVELESTFVYREKDQPALAGFGPKQDAAKGTFELPVADFLRQAWQPLAVKERRQPTRHVNRDEAARMAAVTLVEALRSLLVRAQARISPRVCDSITVVVERPIPHTISLLVAEGIERLMGCRVQLALPVESSECVARVIETNAARASSDFDMLLSEHLSSNLDSSQARALVALGGALVGANSRFGLRASSARRFGLRCADGATVVAPGRAEVVDGDWTVLNLDGGAIRQGGALTLLSYWFTNGADGDIESFEIEEVPVPESCGHASVLVHVDPRQGRLMFGYVTPEFQAPVWQRRRWSASSRLGV